jgi:hypothetical protein
LQADGGETPRLQVRLEVHNGAVPVEIDYIDWEAHSKSMNAVAGANPKAAAVTEVISGGSHEAAQTGPVGLGHGEVGGEIALAGLVEGLAVRDDSRHGFLLGWLCGLDCLKILLLDPIGSFARRLDS